MKITIVADVYGVANNGTATGCRNLAMRLQERGHQVTILSTFAGENETGIKYVQLPKRKLMGFYKIAEKNGVMLAKPVEQQIIKAVADADIVHCLVGFKTSRATIPILRQLQKPYTAGFHSQAENVTSHLHCMNCKGINDYIYKRFNRKFYKHVEFVHTPTQFIADILGEYKFSSRFCVITNGVNPAFKKIEVERPEKYKDKFVIVNTGRYCKEKRTKVLIDAIKKSKYEDKIQLICLGQGPDEKRLKKRAKGLTNAAEFGFWDFKDMLAALNYGDLYVHPSDVEIECLSCLEAMACGMPCVFSDAKTTATNTFAYDERCVFKHGDADDLAKKIDYFIEHPEFRKQLGDYNLAYAERFDQSKAIDQMEDMFRQAIDYYTEYYNRFPDGATHSEFTGHNDHQVKVTTNVLRTKVDKNFEFENRNIFYRMWQNILFGFAKMVVPTIARVKYGCFKIRNKKIMKQFRKKGVVVVANHAHYFDGALIYAKMVGWHKIKFIMQSDILGISGLGKLLVALGGHPTADDIGGAIKSYRKLEEYLKRNKTLLVFPEGSVHPYEAQIREFNTGAFKIAQSANAPIVPIVLTFKQTKKRNGKIKNKLYFTIKDAIYPNQELSKNEGAKDLLERTVAAFNQTIDEFYDEFPMVDVEAKASENATIEEVSDGEKFVDYEAPSTLDSLINLGSSPSGVDDASEVSKRNT